MQLRCLSTVKFCSLTPQERPQSYLKPEEWVGGVMIFMKIGLKPGNKTVNGYTVDQWKAFCAELGWECAPFHIDPNFKVPPNNMLWDVYAKMLEPSDTRIQEIAENTLELNWTSRVGPEHMGEVRCLIVTGRQQLKAAHDVTQAEKACEEVEAESASAVTRQLTKRDVKEFKKKSVHTVKKLLRANNEVDTTHYFEHQPHSKMKRSRQISLKSKNPKHLAKRLKAEQRKGEAAFPERDEAQQEGRGRSLQLTIQERVVGKELPQPDGEEWKYKVAAFLKQEDAPVGSEMELLRFLVPASLHSFIASRSKHSPGIHFPTRESEADAMSTVELHRCILLVEGQAEQLLRACATRLDSRVSKGAPAFSMDDTNDLQVAWKFAGGIAGEGPGYWPEQLGASLPFLPEPRMSGWLHDCLSILKSDRQGAFRRHYLVADRVTWLAPYLSKVYFIKCSIEDAVSQEVYASNIKEALTKITEFRSCVIKADRAPLVSYGVNLLKYTDRLSSLAVTLRAIKEPPPALRKARAFLMRLDPEHRGHAGPAKAAAQKDLLAVKNRRDTEIIDFRKMLRDLGLESSQLYKAAQNVCEKIAQVMETDSHRSQNTMCLHPSPSLPGASYKVENPGTREDGGI